MILYTELAIKAYLGYGQRLIEERSGFFEKCPQKRILLQDLLPENLRILMGFKAFVGGQITHIHSPGLCS